MAMQVCVPMEWTDEQVHEFANRENPTGIQSGWKIRKQGSEALLGKDERVACAGGPAGHVHIMLDC